MRKTLTAEGVVVHVKKPKDNFTKRDLKRVFQTLWNKDDLTFTSEYYRTCFTLIALPYCETGARLSAFFRGGVALPGSLLDLNSRYRILFQVERTAQQRDETTRRKYWSTIYHYKAEQLVFVDESASNERTAERRRGWSPRGFPCRVRRRGRRSKRWLLLRVLNVDGYLAWEIYQDSFTTERFNAFIEIFVLPLMRPYSEGAPCCVLVMDNHSIHYSEELEVMCERKGISSGIPAALFA